MINPMKTTHHAELLRSPFNADTHIMPMLDLAESRRREPDIHRTPMHDQPPHRGPAGLRVTPRRCWSCLGQLALT